MTAIEFSYALEEISRSLRPFALRLTKDSEAANDLIQEAVLKAFVHKEKFSEGTNLKAWFYTIMKNTFITNYQRNLRQNTFVDRTENLHFLNTGSKVTYNLAENSFAMHDILKAIDSLSETYKEPFMMYYVGFKYHEIADKLDIPLGTVKNRIHIARKMLKDILGVYKDASVR